MRRWIGPGMTPARFDLSYMSEHKREICRKVLRKSSSKQPGAIKAAAFDLMFEEAQSVGSGERLSEIAWAIHTLLKDNK